MRIQNNLRQKDAFRLKNPSGSPENTESAGAENHQFGCEKLPTPSRVQGLIERFMKVSFFGWIRTPNG